MAKKIFILSDGTGSQVEENLSNVLKLYRILKQNENQVVFYQPGMGTIANYTSWSRKKLEKKGKFRSLTGANLDYVVLQAYEFLIDVYEPGDEIYMFGYSRGSYIVRVLAGFLYFIGLLNRAQKNLAANAFSAYKKASEENDFKIAWWFSAVIKTRRFPIKFIGVWETVSSVFVPAQKRFGVIQQTLPYTAKNPGVHYFRQAAAIDEKRAHFRLNRWAPSQTYEPIPFDKSSDVSQDIKQVWFCGTHGDVGGGYPEAESGLSKFALKWMVDEAHACGAEISDEYYNELIMGVPRPASRHEYKAPDAMGKIHNPMSLLYWLLEFVPKRYKWHEWPKKISWFGFYFPLLEPRVIEEGANIDHSVVERMQKDATYRPVNMPQNYVEIR